MVTQVAHARPQGGACVIKGPCMCAVQIGACPAYVQPPPCMASLQNSLKLDIGLVLGPLLFCGLMYSGGRLDPHGNQLCASPLLYFSNNHISIMYTAMQMLPTSGIVFSNSISHLCQTRLIRSDAPGLSSRPKPFSS